MRSRKLFLVLVLVLVSTAAWSQWKNGGSVVTNEPWVKSSGTFGAMLAFTDKPDQLFAAWEKPGATVRISETSKAVRGIPIVAVIFFTGCKPNAQGNCELFARFTITSPDGKAWGHAANAELWDGKPPPRTDALQLSHGNLGIAIDPGDPLGVYTVKAEIVDKVAKKKMVLQRDFTAVEAQRRN